MEEGDINRLGFDQIPESERPVVGVRTGGGIVTARGTIDGVVIRLDGRVDGSTLKEALDDFVSTRKAFLAGNEVSLEWIGVRPNESTVSDLSSLLSSVYDITVKASRVREQHRVMTNVDEASPSSRTQSPGGVSSGAASSGAPAEPRSVNEARILSESRATSRMAEARAQSGVDRGADPSRALSLFDGMEVVSEGHFGPSSGISPGNDTAVASAFWDDPDARVIYTTLRSGQKIETDHTLVIMGDVNSGAEIIAGGDIIVLGTLRGLAHAGAYDETGGGRIIFAINLQPTQLRIGSIISRGSTDVQKIPEIARVEDRFIIVEPYQSRNVSGKRRD